MASTKVPSVLWNVAQSLDKDDKALARTNIGVNNTLIGSVPEHYFVTGIEADSTGDLSLIPGRPTVSDLSDLAFDDATGVSPYNSSTNKVATVSSVTKRIGDLDGNLNNTEPGSGKTLTAFSQTDGVVSATFGNISITESQISDFGTYSTDSFKTVSDGTNTITASGTTAALNVTGTSPVNVTANASTNTVTVSVPAATPSSSGAGGSAGLMSAADKEKLDTLSSIASVGTDLMLDNGVISVDTTGTIDAASNSGNNFIMGVGTSIEKSISSDLPCKACFAGGSQSHMIGAEDSFLFGNQSTIGALANDARPDGCIVLGNANKVYGGDHNVAIGTAITVDGTTSPAYSFPNNFTLIGYNLSVNKTTMPTDAMHDGCLILGKYNNETTKGNAIRVTGWGTGSGTNPNENVEELTADGFLWTKSGFYIHNQVQASTRMTKIGWDGVQNIVQAFRIERGESKTTEHQSFASPYEITSQYFQTNNEEPDVPINLRQASMLIHDYNNYGGVGTGEALIEFKSTMNGYDGAGTGFVQIPNALPAYSFDSSAIATSRVRLYGGRTTQPACDLTVHGAPMGNLVLGTVSLNFYNASELTNSNPLRPSQQKGEISIVYANQFNTDGTPKDNTFVVQDYDGIHTEGHTTNVSGYIQSGHFMLLLTVEPTTYTSTYTLQDIGKFAYLLPRT